MVAYSLKKGAALTEKKYFQGSSFLFHALMDVWLICDFMSFSTIFQSYKDDGRMIMKGLCHGTTFTVENMSPRVAIELGTVTSVASA